MDILRDSQMCHITYIALTWGYYFECLSQFSGEIKTFRSTLSQCACTIRAGPAGAEQEGPCLTLTRAFLQENRLFPIRLVFCYLCRDAAVGVQPAWQTE